MASSAEVQQTLLDFVQVLIHQVLFARKVYPEETFEARRHLGVAVRRSRHPELCAYIDGAVRDLADLLRRGEAERLAILVLGAPLAQSSAAPSDVLVVPNVLETFVLELSGAPAAIPGVHKLLEQLRGFLVRVCVCEQQLTPLAPEELSFSLEVHTVHAPSEELCQRWVSCSRSEAGTGPSRIVPLKSMVAEEAGFDMRLLVAQRQP